MMINRKNINRILRYRIIVLLLTGVFTFSACNKDEQQDSPFDGRDSFIVAFNLKQGESIIHAVIAGEEIIVTVPEGLSLTQAKATVTLSENARIYPNPANITDWDEEHVFAVTAYNSGQTKYQYKVKRTGVAHSGSVVLETQADVDTFGIQGITFLEGNLVIGRAAGTDSITSLAPLANLKTVVYTLTLNPTCAITTTNELVNLEHVGALQVGTLPRLETLVLPRLKTAGSINLQNVVTIVIELPELISVSKQLSLNSPVYQLQLSNLRRAGELTIATVYRSNAMLSEINLPQLEEAENVSILYFVDAGKVILPELKKATSLSLYNMPKLSFVFVPQLKTVTGRISFSSLDVLTELLLPELEQTGNIVMYNCAMLYVLEARKLTRIDAIELTNVLLHDFSGFPALQTVGTISLFGMSNMNKLEFPASIQRIDRINVNSQIGNGETPSEINIRGKNVGELSLQSNAILSKIVGDDIFNGILNINRIGTTTNSFPVLEGFREIDSLYVNSEGMNEVHIRGIRKVNKGVYLQSYSSYPYAFSLPDMEEIGGSLSINYRSTSSSVITIDKLKRIGGDFIFNVISTNAEMFSCPELTTIGGNFQLTSGYDYSYSYRGLETLSFPKLTGIGRKLSISPGSTYYNNEQLKNLDGFATLSSVNEIEITGQSTLMSYEGLRNTIQSLDSSDKWKVANNAYNPSYEDIMSGKWTKTE